MRRLLRWAFNGLAALSLLLCVAVCVLWVRSFWVADMVTLRLGTNVYELDSSSGRVGYSVAESKPRPFIEWTCWSPQTPIGVVRWFGTGVRGNNAYHNDPRSSYGVLGIWAADVPMHEGSAPWPVVCLCVVVTALARVLIRRRHPPGLCRVCGYDLRATPGRCLECGTATVKEKT